MAEITKGTIPHQAKRGSSLAKSMNALAFAAALVITAQVGLADTTPFTVNPQVGNNTFTAVFDAVIGERITAVSSAVDCTLTVDEEQLEGTASCSVALTSLMVDNEETKTEHFYQWATNKKSDPKECTLDLEVPSLKLPPPVEEKKPVAFSTEGTFTICGRQREGGKPEQITGTVVYLPPGSYGEDRTLRIRARIETFNREEYGVSPAQTSGWLARIQQLADVVAAEGNIDVNIFATSPPQEAVASE